MKKLKLLQGYKDKYGINLTPEARMQLEELAEMRQALFHVTDLKTATNMPKKKVRYTSWYDWKNTDEGRIAVNEANKKAKSDKEFQQLMVEALIAYNKSPGVNTPVKLGRGIDPFIFSRCAGDIVGLLLDLGYEALKADLQSQAKKLRSR